ncbi:MAG: cation-translocating P-type ATPase [Solirubrobacterales bacterium]|nr:cation-translocating P-type ATPase [Solirubrobacterales bacterium]
MTETATQVLPADDPGPGLSASEAAGRLHDLGPAQPHSSRSTSSIVAGNVFTLFNLIIGIFFVLILSLGLIADAVFGMIAIVNTWIGIRQELKAKETLDRLAILVAPRAEVIRDGEALELLADEVVPGDLIRMTPGDQLVADGRMVSSRGLTVDESMLTGESDPIGKSRGDEVLSGGFVISGSGYCEVTAVREESYAGQIAGEAKAFRHPPSPLQEEVNQVILVCTWILLPLAALLIASLAVRSVGLVDAAQTATAGLITLIPEGLVLLMSVTFAVAAVKMARRATLVQQMSATESLASVDTICVDKTGTLTDGDLTVVEVIPARVTDSKLAARELGRYAASAGDRNLTLEAIAEEFPGDAEPVTGEVAFSSEWKWSALTFDEDGARYSLVLGAPDLMIDAGALRLEEHLSARLAEETAAGRRVVALNRSTSPLPASGIDGYPAGMEPVALVVLRENLRPGVEETLELMRSEDVALKLISGDARATVTAVAAAVGIPADAGVIEGPDLPEDEEALAEVVASNTIFCRIRPDQKRQLVSALAESGAYTAMIGDGVNDVPALKSARMAVAMGSGSQVTKSVADVVLLEDQFSRLPEAIAEGRRIARNIHRLGRLYLTKTVYAAALIVLVSVPGFTFPFLPRHLTLAAFLTIGIPSFVLALAPSDGPLYRGRLLRALAAFAVPAGLATALSSILSYFLVDVVFGGNVEEGRTAATTTLIILGLCFVLLLERGPGREHIAIQSYMLAMIAGLGALFAGILAVPQLREFFDMAMLGAEQWFISMLAAALGLVFASLMWRLPQIQAWEVPDESAFPPLERVPPPENAPPQRPTAGPIHRETTPVHEEAEAATEVIPAEADLLDDRD